MLLEFKTKNYKSFVQECTFSMKVAPKQKGIDYSILTEKAGKKQYKGLCSAIVYGPNASGKTNIIGAMDTFRQIVLRGNIRNQESGNSPNIASNALELIPNNTLEVAQPVDFSITFTTKGLLVTYSISLDLGGFLDAQYPRKILQEKLHVNETEIFNRIDGIEIGKLTQIAHYLIPAYNKNAKGAAALAIASLQSDELFLTNGFKNMFSTELVTIILQWLETHFAILYKSDSMQLVKTFSEKKKQSIYIEKTLNEATSLFGINSNALGYFIDGEHEEAQLCSLFTQGKKQALLPAEMFESYGTMRFVMLFPLILKTLKLGGVLVVDELDAALHPMAIMNIITLFHNDELNIHNAQLIFNTHNPIFLNSNLFRRDEIKFMDRDEETHASTHYSLADFGTAGKTGVRKTEDYMSNYFIDRYGALTDIDLTPIIKNLMNIEE